MQTRHGVVAALLSLVVLSAGDPIAADRQCDIPGYVFKSGLRPSGASVAFLTDQPISSTTAGAVACSADPACTMFTTDGWLLGTKVYFTKMDAGKQQHTLSALLNPATNHRSSNMDLNWWTQPYCGECNAAEGCCGSINQGAPCCGTYMAAVSAQQLALLEPLTAAPAIFSECESCTSASNTEDFCCLDRHSVQATDAPCTSEPGTGRIEVVASNLGYSTNICGEYSASSTSRKFCSPKCTVKVLGAGLNEDNGVVITAGDDKAIDLDVRCGTHTFEDVQASGHPECCDQCWRTCCKALTNHKSHLSGFNPKHGFNQEDGQDLGPNPRQQLEDPALDYYVYESCPLDDSSAVPGSCCQQLSYLQDHMSLMHSECSLDCAQRCGFAVEDVPPVLKGLSCFQSPILYGWTGQYPKWVQQGFLVKQPSPSQDASAASKHWGADWRGSKTSTGSELSTVVHGEHCALC